MKEKRIAIIGGGGFIGHHLALAFRAIGVKVAVVDSFQVNNLLSFIETDSKLYLRMINERIRLLQESGTIIYTQDARDYHALSRMITGFKPNVVIHLAAVAHAGRSNKEPYSTFDHSFRTLENALDCSRNNVEHFIYFSSSMVYGNFDRCHMGATYADEDSSCNPIGIYGALKLGGEKLVIAYNQVFDLPYTIIRPSALYGERCVSRRVGQVFIENAMEGLEIVVEGDGSDSLDFTYIDDLVDGVVLAVFNEKAKGEILNLTYGEARTIIEMLHVLRSEFGEVEVRFVEKNELMPNRGTLSVRKALDILGYDPQWPLEKGFAKYIKWYKEFVDGK